MALFRTRSQQGDRRGHPSCLCLQTCVSVTSSICRVGTDRTCQELRGTETAGEVSCREILAALFVQGDFSSEMCHSFRNVGSFGFRQHTSGLLARHGFINYFKSIFVLTLYTVQEDSLDVRKLGYYSWLCHKPDV